MKRYLIIFFKKELCKIVTLKSFLKSHHHLCANFSLLLLAMICGSEFNAIKYALYTLPPFTLMACCFSGGFILFTLIFRKTLSATSYRDCLAGLVIGFFLFGAFAAQTLSLKWTTVSRQAFLMSTYVIFVPLLYGIIKKRFPGADAVSSAVIAVTGIALMSANTNFTFYLNRGDWTALASAILFAANILTVDYFATHTKHTHSLITSQTGAAAFFFIAAAFFLEPPPQHIPNSTWLLITYIIIFCVVLGLVIQNIAQKYTSAAESSLIMSTDAIFGSVFAILLFNERFTITMFLGAILIFAAIILAQLKPLARAKAKLTFKKTD